MSAAVDSGRGPRSPRLAGVRLFPSTAVDSGVPHNETPVQTPLPLSVATWRYPPTNAPRQREASPTPLQEWGTLYVSGVSVLRAAVVHASAHRCPGTSETLSGPLRARQEPPSSRSARAGGRLPLAGTPRRPREASRIPRGPLGGPLTHHPETAHAQAPQEQFPAHDPFAAPAGARVGTPALRLLHAHAAPRPCRRRTVSPGSSR